MSRDADPAEPADAGPDAGGIGDRAVAALERLGSASIPRRALLAGALLANVQLVAVVAYLVFTDATVTEPRYVAYGLVWVNVGAAVLYRFEPPSAPFGTRRRALAVATAYFGLLAVFSGLLGPGVGEHATGFRVAWLPPGWGPALLYSGRYASVALLPAYTVGYLALAYLVYGLVIDAAGSAVAGVIGLFSCVSCTWPILAAAAATVFGGGGLIAASASALSYDLSTAVFLLTVGLLLWRPGMDRD